MAEELPSNPRGLKAVVIILGIILLGMLVAVVYGVVMKMGGKGGEIAATVSVKPGEQVVDMAGTGDRLVLRLRDAQGAERLIFVDPASGRTLGATAITAAP